mgnify:CR=1 FL=1
MLKDYPSLFQNRTDCFDQLFCVLGNGYEWENGELVDQFKPTPTFIKEKKKRKAKESKILRESILHLDGNLERYYRIYPKTPTNKQVAIRYETIDCHNRIWYPIESQYTPLFNIPDNVKLDWAEAAQLQVILLLGDSGHWNRTVRWCRYSPIRIIEAKQKLNELQVRLSNIITTYEKKT